MKSPQKEETIIHYVDSIAWHDSTVVTYLNKERYVDMVKPLDTLNLETTYARSQAYLDTAAKALKGSIENKTDVPLNTVIKWKEKIVTRDSIVTKEIPVEVPVEVVKYPKSYWWFMAISILAALYAGIKLYLKLKLK
jgi:hypothetical protein